MYEVVYEIFFTNPSKNSEKKTVQMKAKAFFDRHLSVPSLMKRHVKESVFRNHSANFASDENKDFLQLIFFFYRTFAREVFLK